MDVRRAIVGPVEIGLPIEASAAPRPDRPCPAPAAGPGRWYVVQTIRGREQFAKEGLERQKVPTYLPLFAKPVLRRNVIVDRISSFFPGYLFVSLPRSSSLWRSVGGTYGVSRIVRFGEAPAPLPDGLVEHLRSRTGANGLLGFEDNLRPGDRVRVVGGAFDQVYGRLCSIEPSERVVVLLNMMGREVPVKVHRRSIMVCES